MDTPADRLKKAREAAGFASAREAAHAMQVVYDTYAQHENGTRGFKPKRAEQYARRFRVTPEWLLYGKGEQQAADLYPSEEQLIEMVRLAIETEVTMQTRLSDLPHIVGSNLYAQLRQIEAAHEAEGRTAGSPSRDAGAQSGAPTTGSAPAKSRMS